MISDGLKQWTIANGAAMIGSLNNGALAGFRNRIFNGNFAVNQRGYSSGTLLPAGSYSFDRWKAGAEGATLAFSQVAGDAVVTIEAGSLLQIVEADNVEGGLYTLSWSGAAQARVYQGAAAGSYAASPLTISELAAGNAISVEFSMGTLGKAQLEPGPLGTPFERRPIGVELSLCMRYFQSSYSAGVAPGTPDSNAALGAFVYGSASWATVASFPFPIPMRTTPNAVSFSPKSGASGNVYRNNAGVDAAAYFQGISSSCCSIAVENVAVSEEGLQANYTLDAEL